MQKNTKKTDDFVWSHQRKKLQKTLLVFPTHLKDVSGNIRIVEPANIAKNLHKIKVKIEPFYTLQTIQENICLDFYKDKTILFQRQIFTQPFKLLQKIRKQVNTKFVYDIDDLITNIPEHNQFKIIHSPEIILLDALKYTLTYCDVFTVSTPNLANFYNDLHNNIVVIPNRLDAQKWLPLYEKSLQKTQVNFSKMRIGYAGYLSHQADLKLISELIKQTHQQIDWIFFGDCRDEIRPFIKEYHGFVAMENYPQKLASLNLDLAVIPLQDDLFNSCKSNLKLLQLGILGIPLIVSDVGAYENSVENSAGFPITRIKKSNTLKAWKNAVLDHIKNPEETFRQGRLLQQKVLEFGFIQDHIDDYVRVWF